MQLFIGHIQGNKVLLDAEESHHFTKVLRGKVGQQIHLTNGVDKAALVSISQIGKRVEGEVIEFIPIEPKHVKTHIAIAPTKNIDRFDFFIEKAVELGVSEITPILTFHSERKHINFDKLYKKMIGACKQSMRLQFPILHPLQSLSDFLDSISTKEYYFLHCNSNYNREPLSVVDWKKHTLFLVGPEGDFSEQEIVQMAQKGTPIHLGESRLRTETAGIFLSGCYYRENAIS